MEKIPVIIDTDLTCDDAVSMCPRKCVFREVAYACRIFKCADVACLCYIFFQIFCVTVHHNCHLFTGDVVYRTEVAVQVSGYDSGLSCPEDCLAVPFVT